MKKLMILGAGIYQVPLIKKARAMGLSAIVVSYPGPYPGFSLADQCLYLNTTDAPAVLKAAEELQIDGICTTGTDVAISTLGIVAEKLHLTGLSKEAALLATDKSRMKEAFCRSGVATAAFEKVSSYEEAADAFLRLSKPVMVKAVDSSGSRGITKVSSLSELKAACEAAWKVTRQSYLLLEEFLDGEEIGVDGFLQQGEIKLLLPHKKFVLHSGSTALPEGHAFPYQASQDTLRSIEEEIGKAVRALGLDNCAFNADVMICGGRAFLLELGGRAGATGIPELISLYCGFDYYEKMIENALGLKPDFSYRKTQPCMSRLLFSPVDGVITRIDQEALKTPPRSGIFCSLDYREGDPVSSVKNGTDRIGQVIWPSGSKEELDQFFMKLYGGIFVDGVPLHRLWEVRHGTV